MGRRRRTRLGLAAKMGTNWKDRESKLLYKREQMRQYRHTPGSGYRHGSAFGEYVGTQWRELVKRFLGEVE
jgi:hypothetical protein